MLAVPLVARCLRGPVLRAFGTDGGRGSRTRRATSTPVAFGMPAMFVFLAHRYTSEGIGWTRPVLSRPAFGLSTNIAGNWVFMLGGFGIPSHGRARLRRRDRACLLGDADDNGISTSAHRVYATIRPLERFDRPDRTALGEILRSAADRGPVVAEGGLFAVAVLLGTLGTRDRSPRIRSRSVTPRSCS